MVLVKTRRLAAMRKQQRERGVVTVQIQSGRVPFSYVKHRTKTSKISTYANRKDIH